MSEQQDEDSVRISSRVQELIQRLYRDPRYLLLGRIERFGRELISFVEASTLVSGAGDVRGQALINSEYELRGRPDGERPYESESLLDHYLARGQDSPPLGEEEIGALREESWQYYVRRGFVFLLGDYGQARDDAEHNLGIWNLVEQSDAGSAAKWGYLRWWPWIERDRAVAQALLCVKHGQLEDAATELYRAQRNIDQYGERHAEQYGREEDSDESLCVQMRQHIAALVELLREDHSLPVSLEEQLDEANARGDAEGVERLRKEMIRRAVDEGE
jgi:hypothetical protein